MVADWTLGDPVVATTVDGRSITGRLAGLTTGAGDAVVEAYVIPGTDGAEMVAVEPGSLRYQTDAQGFAFRFDHRLATLTIRRNDGFVADMAWWRRTGAELLFRSMHPTQARRRVRRARS